MRMLMNIWTEIGKLGRQITGVDQKLQAIEAVQDLQSDMLGAIHALLLKVQAALTPPPAVALGIQLGGDIRKENNMLKVKDTGSVMGTLEAKDALGNPGATLDQPPTYALSDTELGSVNASEDGMSFVVVLSGKLGTFKVVASAKAEGKDITGESDEIEVDAGAAALLSVSVSAQ